MAKYLVETDQGNFEVETEEAQTPSWLDKAKMYAYQLGETVKQQGKGALRSFGVDTRTPEEKLADELSGSTMATPEQKAGTLSRKIGGYAGEVGNIALSALPAGVEAKALQSAYKFGPFAKAVVEGGLTGATYGALKGAENQTPPMETVKNMGEQGLGFGALGGASYPIQKAGQWLTNNVPEGLANQYIMPEAKVAKDLYESNKPSLGKQLLRRTDVGIGQSKDQVFRNMGGELENNEMLVQSALDKRVAQATPSPFIGPPEGEYIPLDIREGSKIPGPGSNLINPDLSVQTPRKVTKEFTATRPTPMGEDTYPYGNDLSAEKTYEVYKTVPSEKTVSGGEFVGKPTNVGGTYKKGLLGEDIRTANIEKPNVDLDATRQKLFDIAKQQEQAGFPDVANGYREVANEIGAGRSIVDLKEGNVIRRTADDFVNTAHLSDPNKLSSKVDAWRIASNDLRDQIATQAPEVGSLLDRNHFLMNVRGGLLPQVAGTAPIKSMGEVSRAVTKWTTGSRAGLGLARLLEASGESGIPGGYYESGTRLGLTEGLKKKNQ